MHPRTALVGFTFALLAAPAVQAGEPPTQFSLGLSYLATTGNSSSKSGGLDLAYKHKFDPWGIEASGTFLHAEEDGTVTAEKYFVGGRGTHTLTADLDLFLDASYLKDRFAGLDPRFVVAGGATYKFLKGPEHELACDAGLTWTKDKLVDDGSRSYMGALVAGRYTWNISKTSKFTENLSFYPSFEKGSDWRIESQTGLQAAVSTSVAVKLAYNYRYANEPVAGFGKTDTQTTVSLVLTFI